MTGKKTAGESRLPLRCRGVSPFWMGRLLTLGGRLQNEIVQFFFGEQPSLDDVPGLDRGRSVDEAPSGVVDAGRAILAPAGGELNEFSVFGIHFGPSNGVFARK